MLYIPILIYNESAEHVASTQHNNAKAIFGEIEKIKLSQAISTSNSWSAFLYEEFTHTTVRIWSLAATAVTNIYTRRVILLLIICYTDGLCLLVQGKVWAKLMVFNWCGEPSRRCEKKMVRYRLKTFVIIALRRALCILFLFQFNNKYYKL